jgi:phage tail-like protein
MPESKLSRPASNPNPANYITANRFYVELGGSIVASFTEFSGIGVQLDKEVYFEGGVNDQQRILLKHAKFNDVTLKRGMSDNIQFWGWLQNLLNLGNATYKPENDNDASLRHNVSISLFNQAGETMQSWRLIGAVPVAWKAPAFQASATVVAIEEVTLAYEGLQVFNKKTSSGASVTHRDNQDRHIETG